MGWPTTNDPRTVFVTTRLTAAEAADLDWLVANRGLTRSEALRAAVDHEVARAKKAQRAQAKKAQAKKAQGTGA